MAALTHVAWWIAIAFLAMLALNLTVVVLAVAGLEPRMFQQRRHRKNAPE